MTNEHKFKVGDKVRFTGDYTLYAEGALEKGEEYAVTYVDSNGNCDLSVPCPVYTIDAVDLELVEPYDRRLDFLRRLQSLLREFDASFVVHKTDMPVSVYFKDNVVPSVSIGKEINKGCGVVVTADNVMDFDKS